MVTRFQCESTLGTFYRFLHCSSRRCFELAPIPQSAPMQQIAGIADNVLNLPPPPTGHTQIFGIAEFRPVQRSILNATLSGQDCFLVMPTVSFCQRLTRVH